MPLIRPEDPAPRKMLQLLAIKWGTVFVPSQAKGAAAESRAARLAYCSAVCFRPISSMNELTMAEAVLIRNSLDSTTKG